MAPPSCSIGHNIAESNSHQWNIIINYILESPNARKAIRDIYKASRKTQMDENEMKEAFPNYLKSLFPGDTDALDVGDISIEKIFQREEKLGESASVNLRNECFPHTIKFIDDMDKCLHCYPGLEATIPCAIDALDEENIKSLNDWMKSHNKEVLLIQWSGGDIRTTDLTLELIGIYKGKTNEPVLSHFCDRPAEETHGQYDHVIQDLIVQLLEKQACKFTESGLSHIISKCREVADDTEELWKLLKVCLVSAGLRSIVIMLDNVDSMETTGGIDGLGKMALGFYDGLKSLLGQLEDENNLVAKVIITSRSLEAASCFGDVASLYIEIS